MGVQVGFYVIDWDVLVKGCYGCYYGGGGIVVDQYVVGLGLFQQLVDVGKEVCGEVVECLVWYYYIEVVIGFDGEQFQYLCQYLFVLVGGVDDGFDGGFGIEGFDQWCYFDGFGVGIEN